MILYTWQFELWQHLWQGGSERFPHAVLLSGNAGIGKRDFANSLANSLLCQRRRADNHPCGECDSCRYFEQNAHPDFRLSQPDAEDASEENEVKEKKASEFITINQIRLLGEFISLTSHQNGRRVGVICPAEQLNVNAANALLKMLEEPPPQTIFILVTNQLSRILPTIRSRCRIVKMPVPNPVQAAAWLEAEKCVESTLNLALAGGAPLEALEHGRNAESHTQRKRFCDTLSRPAAGDPIMLAESIAKLAPATVMRWLHTWIYDLMSVKATARSRYHNDLTETLNNLSNNTQLIELNKFNSELIQAKRLLHHPLNAKLFWELLFIKYFSLFS